MRDGGRVGRTGLVTVFGISIAVGALLVLAMLPAVTSAIRSEGQAVLASADPTCFTGGSPRNPGYDPVTHEMYVPNEGNPGVANITVLNKTCHQVGTINLPAGALPFSAAFDPADNEMYVTDYALNQVYLISGTKIVTTLTGFNAPKGLTFDEYLDAMVIINSGNDTVNALFGSYNAGTLFFTGTDPYGIAYDPTCACDLVTNTGSDNVTVYNDVSQSWFSTPVGKSPRGIATDLVAGYVYVADSGSNKVTILIDGQNTPGDVLSGFDEPYGVSWDQATLTIWVTNAENGKVFEIDGYVIAKELSTASDSEPLGLAYDEYNDDMYVTGFETDVAYVLH